MSKKTFKNNHQLSYFVGHSVSPTCRTVYRCLCAVQYRISVNTIENRIYIRGEFRQSRSMNFSVPFSLKGSSKCTNHVNVHKLYAVEYINIVCSLDYNFNFEFLKSVK